MNEASGNALDAVSGLNLTAFANPGAVPGVKGGARSFVSASSQRFNHADHASLQLAATETIALWVKFSSLSAVQAIVRREVTGTTDFEILYWQPTNEIQCSYRYAGGSFSRVVLVSGVVVNTWYCVGVKWDGANIYKSLNGANWTALAAYANAPANSASAITTVGASVLTGTPSAFLDGMMDALTWFKGVGLSNAEIAAFYNAGAGAEFDGTNWS